MSGYSGLIQPIVVRKTGTHEEMVEAAARASVLAWLRTPNDPAWQPWLAGSFGKTVRRARSVEIDKAHDSFVASAVVGEAEAFACLPCPSDAVPAPIRKMQVTGTDRERGTWAKPDNSTLGPTVVVNLGADMSTGKTCAQVAHAVFAWALIQDQVRLTAWQDNNMPCAISDATQERFDGFRRYAADRVIVIEDAGHTEVAPGTATVLVYR